MAGLELHTQEDLNHQVGIYEDRGISCTSNKALSRASKLFMLNWFLKQK
jgi:hypothetical protein